MSKNLVIVESPAKAKTIETFLGKDFHVLSSQGHIRDIEPDGKNTMGVDFTKDYAPHYVIDSSKKSLIETLRKESEKAETVWLASDEDREGEAISWHLQEVLKLDPAKTKRIVFHEITKTAILEAIEQPRGIDYNLVHAQQARRVMDRIVGYELSPVLWKRIIPGLSAGRVQSVAVRLIVEREREIENFNYVAQYRVLADFIGKDVNGQEAELHTELNHRFDTKEEAIAFLENCKTAEFAIQSVQKTPVKRVPASPFTTSLLQQEAARKLHFTVSKTMRIAQTLYEAGKITYMRTDSKNLSQLAINTSRQVICEQYGEAYHKARQYKTNTKGAQEAHEAIRPTYMNVMSAGRTEDEKKLYALIWQRTIASQMADAELETTTIEVKSNNQNYTFVAKGDVVMFDGFMKVYVQSTDDADEEATNLLPQFAIHQPLGYKEMVAQESYSRAPFRYTEASLVKKMEELEIGRPSTYVTIIETIQTRKYVKRASVAGFKRSINVLTLKGNKIADKQKNETYGADSSKLLPTDLGRVANDFLVMNFPTILSYDFTAQAEEDFDKVAVGEKNWVKVVDDFYKPFHESIVKPQENFVWRQLGIDKASGKPVIAKIGKKGPCIQIGTAQDAEKPRFASLKEGQSIYTINMEEAMQLFESAYPYILGEYEGEEIVVALGMYGPYVKCKDIFGSVPKSMDAENLTLEEGISIIEERKKAALPLKDFGDIQILNGKWGPYIRFENANYKLPRGAKVNELTEADCRNIIANQPATATKTKAKK